MKNSAAASLAAASCGVGYPTASSANVFGPTLQKTISLGGEIESLLGLKHPSSDDKAFNKEYFDRILDNQEKIISAISEVAKSVQIWADILELIPYKTLETDQTLRANTVFTQSQGLLISISDAITKGENTKDIAFQNGYKNLVDTIDSATARYLSVVSELGQSHDICVSARPLWNAIQSVRDAGTITESATTGYQSRLKTMALRVRDTASTILGGAAPLGDPNLGVFLDRYKKRDAEVKKAAKALASFKPKAVNGKKYYSFQISRDFLAGKGDNKLTGQLKFFEKYMTSDCRSGFWGPDGELVCTPPYEKTRKSDQAAAILRSPFSQKPGMEGVFAIIIEPYEATTTFASLVEDFNAKSGHFYHYFSANMLLEEVVMEIQDSLSTW